jgi:putative ABC transport system permease protein
MMFKIAFRSIFRNSRRSIMTMLTIAVGGAAMLVFGAYAIYDVYVLQTSTVERGGHLAVFRKGYLDFGTGSPAIWGIDKYPSELTLIERDPVLATLVAVATPVQYLGGIAENPDNQQSKTFFATGVVPSDLVRMEAWDEYHVGHDLVNNSGLDDSDPSLGIIGVGFVRMLGLCERLRLPHCPKLPANAPSQTGAAPDISSLSKQDFSRLASRDVTTGTPGANRKQVALDLLAATAGGAPNIVSMTVARVEDQGNTEMDNSYAAMNLALAQQLVYGRGEHKATGIVLQLHRTEDIPAARARLAALVRERHLDLEIRDFMEINAYYGQTIAVFRSFFLFIAVIIGVVVLFTVSNAMGMSVMERIDEIGTTRALGVRRSKIRAQFLAEGFLLGMMGATLAVAFAFLATYGVNNAGLTWTPTGDSHAIPLKLYMLGAIDFIVAVWIVLTLVATLAAFLPANRAARLPIVDALRHV